MSQLIEGQSISLPAAADLSAKQYFAVKVDANGRAALAAAGDMCCGILQNKPNALDMSASVMTSGVAKWSAGAAISKGDAVASDANGQAKTAVKGKTDTSDAGAASDPLLGSNVFGIALEAATALNDVIAVLITHAGSIPTTPS